MAARCVLFTPGDADQHGDVDLDDLNAVRNHFGTIAAGQAVPEPAGLLLALLALPWLPLARRNRPG